MTAQRYEAEIEAILEEQTGRACVYLPSCRLGIYIALVNWLRPGARVLMSPCSDDVVLFTVLAAGVRPVMAPLSSDDGNIDPAGVPDRTWESVDGVLTTNLYGLPDRAGELVERCRRLGLVLVEDVAHALHTEIAGRPVGSFGDVSAFSLSKHMAGVGGAVAIADPSRRAEVVSLRDQLVLRRSMTTRIDDVVRPRTRALLKRLGVLSRLRSARRSLGLAERREHRMELRPERLREAIAASPALERFDSWVRVDKHDYLEAQREDLLAATVQRLRNRGGDREARIEGVNRLRGLMATAAGAKAGDAQALYRVPLLVEDREALGSALEAAGHPLQYVYDPPFDDYAGPEIVDPSPSPQAARWWARHAVPVDPLLPETAAAALDQARAAVAPAEIAPRSG
jgi:dTDP-4-amino-4,6-dideoxygalactose transaminase